MSCGRPDIRGDFLGERPAGTTVGRRRRVGGALGRRRMHSSTGTLVRFWICTRHKARCTRGRCRLARPGKPVTPHAAGVRAARFGRCGSRCPGPGAPHQSPARYAAMAQQQCDAGERTCQRSTAYGFSLALPSVLPGSGRRIRRLPACWGRGLVADLGAEMFVVPAAQCFPVGVIVFGQQADLRHPRHPAPGRFGPQQAGRSGTRSAGSERSCRSATPYLASPVASNPHPSR